MCWECMTEEGGDQVDMTLELRSIANAVRDWYVAHEDNACGGILHVQLDDFNLDDEFLGPIDWSETYGIEYTAEQRAMADALVERLRALTVAQRTAVCWHAHRG